MRKRCDKNGITLRLTEIKESTIFPMTPDCLAQEQTVLSKRKKKKKKEQCLPGGMKKHDFYFG